MIPRYQRIIFAVLLGSSIVMAIALVWLHQRAQRSHLRTTGDETPLAAPSSSDVETLPFTIANDSDETLTNISRDVAVPAQPAIRARALLERLLASYALPGSEHTIPGGIAVDDVFLVNLPLTLPLQRTTDVSVRSRTDPAALSREDEADPLAHSTGELAIVNLRSSWLQNQPSGIQTETLTLLSIIGTLHANLPTITHVRFLVDGLPRATLAGHVDLTRTYAAVDTANTTEQVH